MAATAVEAWDERWARPEGRADWLMPHPAVAALVPVLTPKTGSLFHADSHRAAGASGRLTPSL
jgi:hypothetical protein